MPREYHFYVYIVSNYQRTTFYIGFTNDIVRRIIEHKNGLGSAFTKKYKLTDLIYFEEYQYADQAISREKELKGWVRRKKLALIKKNNPKMENLNGKLFNDYGISDEEIKEYIKEIKDNLSS